MAVLDDERLVGIIDEGDDPALIAIGKPRAFERPVRQRCS